jgi:macrolide transport system ATP-binding/permease protein
MTSLWRRLTWWVQRRRKEDDLREELRFHLEEEADERRVDGLADEQARWAAHRDLGNLTLVREDTRAVWIWSFAEQLAQDARYALRTMLRNRTFTALAALSLALGIGANTAIYSFMDAILLRSLPVHEPESLVVMKWRSKPWVRASPGAQPEFVLHSVDGRTYRDASGVTAAIFPYPAFEQLRQASAPVLSSLFAYFPGGKRNVVASGQAELADSYLVSGDFFRGLAVAPAAGRLIVADDDRFGAAAVAVVSMGFSLRRFGSAAAALGQSVLIDTAPFTIVGVTPSGFFGVDPGAVPDVYLPLHAIKSASNLRAENDYWLQMMGRVRPGVSLAQAQAVLGTPFAQWAASTATTEGERANLPVLWVDGGAGGLDTLRRLYSKPLYVLLAMVGLILAIACANTANLLLARATSRRREIAVRLGMGAGRLRLVRQLLTESILLASLAGVLGVGIAMAGVRVLTVLLANGQERFTLHAELNWHVLLVTFGLSVVCGMLFGLAPAIQSTRLDLMPTLKDARVTDRRTRGRDGRRRLTLTQTLVVAQVTVSLLLLVGAGLFVRTLSNLQSVDLGFNRDNVLLFDVNAAQTGRTQPEVAAFYADLRQRLRAIPGVRQATMSHASLIRAGRQIPVLVNGASAQGARILGAGPRFFTTMQLPLLYGRDIDERDRPEGPFVAVVSEPFAKTYFGGENPVGKRIQVRLRDESLRSLDIIGVAGTARYGGLKGEIPPVVYIPYAQVPIPLQQMTYALRTDGDPLRYAGSVRAMVRDADARLPVANIKTLAADIDQTINQEIVFARLCSAFAILALIIAAIGIYGTMAYTVARRTSEIGIRIALGAGRGTVIWAVLREVFLLAAVGLAIGVPIALGASRLIESFLFQMEPNDPGALTLAVSILLGAALVAGYGPAWRASRIRPIVALREE